MSEICVSPWFSVCWHSAFSVSAFQLGANYLYYGPFLMDVGDFAETQLDEINSCKLRPSFSEVWPQQCIQQLWCLRHKSSLWADWEFQKNVWQVPFLKGVKLDKYLFVKVDHGSMYDIPLNYIQTDLFFSYLNSLLLFFSGYSNATALWKLTPD